VCDCLWLARSIPRSLHGGQPLLNRGLTAVAPDSQPEQFIQSLLKLRIVHTTSCSLYRSKLACCTICYASRRPLHAEEKNWFYPRSSAAQNRFSDSSASLNFAARKAVSRSMPL